MLRGRPGIRPSITQQSGGSDPIIRESLLSDAYKYQADHPNRIVMVRTVFGADKFVQEVNLFVFDSIETAYNHLKKYGINPNVGMGRYKAESLGYYYTVLDSVKATELNAYPRRLVRNTFLTKPIAKDTTTREATHPLTAPLLISQRPIDAIMSNISYDLDEFVMSPRNDL